MFSIFRKSIAVWIAPRLRRFVLLVGATCGCKWVLNIGEITKVFETRSTQRKTCPNATFFTRFLTWSGLGSHVLDMVLYHNIFFMSALHGCLLHILAALLQERGQCTKNLKVAGSIPDFDTKSFIDINLLAAMWSWGRQPLTEISASNIALVVKAANAWDSQPYHLHVLIV